MYMITGHFLQATDFLKNALDDTIAAIATPPLAIRTWGNQGKRKQAVPLVGHCLKVVLRNLKRRNHISCTRLDS
ncbi:MAG: hypothetical protein Ct9H300mP28_12980 [Pseudomonadota bacterium]|nr:MAG: hypothetical protein Ct9H300mP28_12980 [Pseudomonadota bacterium]